MTSATVHAEEVAAPVLMHRDELAMRRAHLRVVPGTHTRPGADLQVEVAAEVRSVIVALAVAVENDPDVILPALSEIAAAHAGNLREILDGSFDPDTGFDEVDELCSTVRHLIGDVETATVKVALSPLQVRALTAELIEVVVAEAGRGNL